MIKKISIILYTVSFYFFAVIPIYAASSVNPCPKNASGGLSKLCGYNTSTLAKIITNSITMLLIIAVLASLFFLIAGGIKWITSGGDKAGVEQARNWIIASIVGLVITFLSFFIISFVLNFFGLKSLGDFTIPNLI